MNATTPVELYSPKEIANAAGLPETRVIAVLGKRQTFLSHEEAVALGRTLLSSPQLFSMFDDPPPAHPRGVPVVLSSTLHIGALVVAVFVLSLSPNRVETAFLPSEPPSVETRMVFLNTPGPGGGGGGGGRLQKIAPPKALREGPRSTPGSVPIREPPAPVVLVARPAEQKPVPLAAESLPIVVAPIVASPADARDRAGVLQEVRSETESRGQGHDGGVGAGAGTGLGVGDGPGVGPGSGGGTGGGPFRPGSGIVPPRVLREVKADYTDDARRARIVGDVVLEIVVRRDGSVGDITLLQGLQGGLNDRAVQAVRQWRFAPATRHGVPVDVIVEVAVQFKLR